MARSKQKTNRRKITEDLYEPPDLQVMKGATKAAKQREASRGTSFMRIKKDGRTRWRILPPWSAKARRAAHFFAVTWTHFQIRGVKTAVRCLKNRDGVGDCPVCDVIDEYQASGLGRHERRAQCLFNVIKRSKKGGDRQGILQGPATMGDKLFILVGQALAEEKRYILHPKDGFDITIERKTKGSGDGAWPDYSYSVRLSSTPACATDEEIAQLRLADLYIYEDHTDEMVKECRKAARVLRKIARSRLSADENANVDEEEEEEEEEEEDEEDEEEEEQDLEDDDAEPDHPRGYREDANGKPRRPPNHQSTGKPVCFGDWLKRGNKKSKKTRHPQCKTVCPLETTCRFRALKRAKKAATT